jgi:hypothetical protein
LLTGEEGGEIAQAASKCLRFTPTHAYYDTSNIARLETEVRDLLTVLDEISKRTGYIFNTNPCEEKRKRIYHHMRTSKSMGLLSDPLNELGDVEPFNYDEFTRET